ncbi:MAG: hypothetical protein K0Q55_238 [Verrucomicrobia bacterium]|jgi:hypothetical protein|nr:hypothetical protein [Verrucomicrobiota bacterium]
MAKMIPIYSTSSQTEIEWRARELFEAEGRPENRDLELWLRAEADYLGSISQKPGVQNRGFLRLGVVTPTKLAQLIWIE